MTLILTVILVALVFEYINGFHDTANSIATVVSTTHNISAAIMGVGAARKLSAVKWPVVESMVWAWIFTIPVAGGIGFGLVKLLQALGVIH